MNQKNSLGLDICFEAHDDPLSLFNTWYAEAEKSEINDPNAFALGTSDSKNQPNVRMVLLKAFSEGGFIFYTNLDSKKSEEIKNSQLASMCFYWKSLKKQVRVIGKVKPVSNKEADEYFSSRSYVSRIGAWASKQSARLKSREELLKKIDNFKRNYPEKNNVERPPWWSGWKIHPEEIEFWLEGKNRIHERLIYINKNGKWLKELLYP